MQNKNIVTIFSLTSCKFCIRAKQIFKDNSLDYVEINLDSYPQKRQDMILLTKRLTVPQIFFNNQHIGGFTEINELNESNSLKQGITNNELKKNEQFNTMLLLPDEPPTQPFDLNDLNKPLDTEYFTINGEQYSDWQIRMYLVNSLNIQDRSQCLQTYKQCFLGSDAVIQIQQHFQINAQEATQLGQQFQSRKIFEHIYKDQVFKNEKQLYQLQQHQDLFILNNYKTLPQDYIVQDPLILLSKLSQKFSQIKSRFTDSTNKVDYIQIRGESEWHNFQEKFSELQNVNLFEMDNNEKQAFIINIYNLAIQVAFVVIEKPQSAYQKFRYFDNVKMKLSNLTFSFNDLENGILRNNRKAPYHIFKQFSNKDDRNSLKIEQPDNRIHFALNCGAQSCPMVNRYTKQALNEELEISAQAFCEDENNVQVDLINKKLILSKIFDWYSCDFGKDNREILISIQGFIKDPLKLDQCNQLLKGSYIMISYFPYDWSTDQK